MKFRKSKYENQKTEKSDLFRKTQTSREAYRKRSDETAEAIRNVLREGGDNILWVDEPTAAGNNVPLHVMLTAYSLWDDAQRIACKRGLDGVDAAEAMTKVVHQIADRLADSSAPVIRNLRNYLFVGYTRVLERIAVRNVGVRRENLNKNMSDNGAFLAVIENVLLCDEILNGLPPQLREMVIFKYKYGYRFDELAAAAGSNSSAIRKAVNTGVRKAFDVYMRDLRKRERATNRRKPKKQ